MFIKGISFGFMGPAGYYRGPVGVREAERICETGVSWVALIVTVVQERYGSTRMFSDFHYTPSDRELAEVIAKFKRERLAPGEMEHIALPRVLLDKAPVDELTIEIEEA